MKTVKNLLCVVLCFLMAFSPLTLVASAEGEDTGYTYSFKAETMSTDAQFAKITLDAIDELLAQQNIKFDLVAGVSVDLTSVNGVCETLDLIKGARAALLACGDLSELNLRVWDEDMSRPKDDIKILKELIELISTTEKKLGQDNANPAVIAGLLDGKADLGVIDNFFSINDLLGDEGISGILKDVLFGLVANKDSEPEKFNEIKTKYNNDVDGFVYGPLLTKFAGEYLGNFTMTKDTTVEVLICSLFNALIEQYVLEWVGSLNVDLAAQGNADLAKLAGIINLNGSTYGDLSSIRLDPKKDLLSQANNLVGDIFGLIVPGFAWKDGEYTEISANIENLFKYVGTESGLIPDADEMSREEIVMAIIEIILSNVDIGAYGAGLTECKTLEDMAKVALVNTARELDVTYTYGEDDDYLVVLGDILATWAYDNFDIKDTAGNPYRGGKGHSVWTVANYFVNYFMFDKGAADFFNLPVKATDSIFKKIDVIADLFGEKGTVDFDSKKFIEGLLDAVFTLDIQKVLELTAVPALDIAGDVKAVKFVYNTVRYLLNNWTDKDAVPAYSDNGKAFTNLLTNANIAKLLENLLLTLGERKDSLVKIALFVSGLIINKDAPAEKISGTPVLVSIGEAPCTGALSEATTAKVTLDGKELTYGVDYIAIVDGATLSDSANARIKFIGKYRGPELNGTAKVVLAEPEAATLSYTSDEIVATFKPLAGAVKYIATCGSKEIEIDASDITSSSYKVKFSDLKAATKYTVKIKAIGSDGSEKEYPSKSVYTKPAKTKGLKASSVKVTSLKLSWSKASGSVAGYVVERSTDGKKWEKVATTTSTSYTVKSLKSYTTYYFRVRSYVKNGSTTDYGSYSDTLKAMTELGNVSVTATATKDTVTLTWDKVTGAKKYRVEKKDGKKWVKVTETSKNTYTFKKLKNETKYEYRVRAQVSSKNYSDFDTVSIYTKATAVSKLKASSVKDTSLKLTWSKKSGATGYTIYKSTDGKKWTKVGTAKSSATSYTVKGLDYATSYQFKVVATTKKSTTEDAIVKAKTSASKVTGLKVSSIKGTSATATWSKKSGATGYEVSYRVAGAKSWTTKKVTGTSLSLTGLSRNKSYEVRVRAYSKGGTGSWSSTVTFKTASSIFG